MQDGLLDESLIERWVLPVDAVVDANGGVIKRFRTFDPDSVMLAPPFMVPTPRSRAYSAANFFVISCLVAIDNLIAIHHGPSSPTLNHNIREHFPHEARAPLREHFSWVAS